MHKRIIKLARDHYQSLDNISLHAPILGPEEEAKVAEVVRSTMVSSVGPEVTQFEELISNYTRTEGAVATVNGTAALHICLKVAGVQPGDLVLTQALTFVATCNAISYCGADPVFIDVDEFRLSLSPVALQLWLSENAFLDQDGACRTKSDKRRLRACVPMHTFGHPADMRKLIEVCQLWNLVVIEDSAESLGSFVGDKHTGTFGYAGAFSFNGNKIITTGGGGMIVSSKPVATYAKHLTTTARIGNSYDFAHDEVGFNYRLPNLNAALGCVQMERLTRIIEEKRSLALKYVEEFKNSTLRVVTEPDGCRSNYWLNAVICEDKSQRDEILKETNNVGVSTRPVWNLMTTLPMYKDSLRGNLDMTVWLGDRLLNLPSGARAVVRY